MANTKKSVLPKILISFLVVILLLILIAEFGLRWFIGNELKSEFETQIAQQGISTEEEPSISFGAYPLLLGMAQGKIHGVTINTPDSIQITQTEGAGSTPEVAGTPEAQLEISGLTMDTSVADSLQLTTQLSDEFILATLQSQMAASTGGGTDLASLLVQELVKITALSSNPENQSVEVEFSGGAARASLRPITVDGQLSFEVLDSQLFGMNLPEDISTMLSDGIKSSVQNMSAGLRMDSIEVVDGGIAFSMSGENIDVNTLEVVQ